MVERKIRVSFLLVIILLSSMTLSLKIQTPNVQSSDGTWYSVALFFNLNLPSGYLQPSNYAETTVQNASDFLDEYTLDTDPDIKTSMSISDFVRSYFRTLSYDHLDIGGVDTPRESNNDPKIPTISPGAEYDGKTWDGEFHDDGALIRICVNMNAEQIWQAAGGLVTLTGGYRMIPSVLLVKNYDLEGNEYAYSGFTQQVNGHSYMVNRTVVLRYRLNFQGFDDLPGYVKGREVWGVLCHELGHNFADLPDLYGPQGCTGYWDMAGSCSPVGRMSEVCSFFKERLGWITPHIIEGPTYPETWSQLYPYTTSGDAIKVIPDPQNNPYEYFLLEYRKSTGSELWRPDGNLTEEGLLIIHINERLGVPYTWMMREAPFFDVEYANFTTDKGTTLFTYYYYDWTKKRDGHWVLRDYAGRAGALFLDSRGWGDFTPCTSPNSNFYGGRKSGLYITYIHLSGGPISFKLKIEGSPTVGWIPGLRDRCVSGHFTAESHDQGAEIFIRSDSEAALLVYRQGQWLVRSLQEEWIGDWHLGELDYEVVGDFDGDSRDEIYIRSKEWAGLLKWHGYYNEFRSLFVEPLHWIWRGAIDQLGSTIQTSILESEQTDVSDEDYREHAADVDGDGCDEIIASGPEYLAGFKLHSYGCDIRHARALTHLDLEGIEYDWIDDWNLGIGNQFYEGHFRTAKKEDILVRSDQYLGLLSWEAEGGFKLEKKQTDTIWGPPGHWSLGSEDKHTIGDFIDGDGFDEIYIRSPSWAGILKWDEIASEVALVWIKEGYINPITTPSWDPNRYLANITLDSSDISYAGRFGGDPDVQTDGILHRNVTTLAVLTWNGTGMHVRQILNFPCRAGGGGPVWDNVGISDGNNMFVLGDFHRQGMDIAEPWFDYVGDNLTDIFIYTPGSLTLMTATIGVNFVELDPIILGAVTLHEEIGMIWYQPALSWFMFLE